MGDRMVEKVAWMYAVYRWRIKPTIGLTLKGLSQSQQYEATDMSRAVLEACHFDELVEALKTAVTPFNEATRNPDGHPVGEPLWCAEARAVLAKVEASDA